MIIVNTKHLLLILFLGIQTVNAQKVKEFFKSLYKEKDSTYITVFNESIISKISVNTQANVLTILDNQKAAYRLVTNNNYRVNLYVDYDFLGFSYGFAPNFIPENNDDNRRGSSTLKELNFRFIFRRWIQTIQNKTEKGFYAENTKDLLDNWNADNDTFILFPELQTKLWEGTTSFLFNPNFSIKNSLNNNEWQRKSAGSFIPTLKYSYSEISSDFEALKKHNQTLQFYLIPNYFYTWVIKENWFITTTAGAAFGLNFALQSNFEKTDTYIPFLINGSLQGGYNSNNLTFGANLLINSTHHNYFNKESVINDNVYFNFYLGYRFNSPKSVKTFFKKVKRKIGI